MSDSTGGFANMVPGFDFLQNLVKNAGAAMPGVGQWIAPTLDPEEIEKRISELRTVQFWLEQNARLLGTTIQALEVQRMTLTTLKTMNVSFGDLTESLKIRMPEAAPAPTPAPTPAPAAAPARAEPAASSDTAAPVAPAGVIDPMQWWGALTQQFSELAANAMKESNAEAARNLAGSMVQQGIEAAGASLKQATAMPMAAAQKMAAAAPRAAAKPGGAPASAQAAAPAKTAGAKKPGASAAPKPR